MEPIPQFAFQLIQLIIDALGYLITMTAAALVAIPVLDRTLNISIKASRYITFILVMSLVIATIAMSIYVGVAINTVMDTSGILGEELSWVPRISNYWLAVLPFFLFTEAIMLYSMAAANSTRQEQKNPQ